ncbi:MULTISPECIES: hypothetical protein [unclassified Clostridioides]|uniref:hypothetical protein n=1 Tax=unclassified Clostridioides TaxID=2635829 RepID=UPI001D127954|nr:hypothetical protein [Clostridioides sp. ZZV14-6048]MCC0739970.1 hypothetical protein [Clostridioides sp. ZZV14-5902]
MDNRIFLLILSSIVIFSSCICLKVFQDETDIRHKSNFQLDFNTENEIVKNIKSNKPIDLKKIINVDFEKVYICNSYLIVKEKIQDVLFISYIEQKLKDKEDLDGKSPYNDKDYNYLVFMNENNKVIRFAPLNKDYEILDTNFKEYNNENAVFEFEAKKTGEETVYKLK